MDEMQPVRIVDVTTGELLLQYEPGNPEDIPAIIAALRRAKDAVAEAATNKRAIEQAFLQACPNGYKAPGISVGVDINIGQEDAKVLVNRGFAHLVGLSESVKYRLLKTEIKKLEKLAPESYDEVMDILAGCTRSLRLDDKEAE